MKCIFFQLTALQIAVLHVIDADNARLVDITVVFVDRQLHVVLLSANTQTNSSSCKRKTNEVMKKNPPAVSCAYVCCDLLIPVGQSFLVVVCPNVVAVVTIFLLFF